MGCPLGLAPEAALEDLGLPQVRPRCGCGAAAWVVGVLAAPGTQRGWWLGQQEIQCCRRVWPICSSVLAWRTPLPDREAWQAKSTGLQRVRHNWSDSVHIDTTLFQPLGQEDPLKRKWQSTPVFLPEKHGQRSLAGYSPWGCEESDMPYWKSMAQVPASHK